MRSSPARRLLSTTLVVLATVLAFGSMYAVWARRQALDSSTWADTSTQILRNDRVRLALATYLADQLVANADARAVIGGALLTPAERAAPDARVVLHAAIVRAAQKAFTLPAAEQAWRAANVLAQRELIDLLDGGSSGALAVRNGQVVLNLRALVRTLATQIHLDPSLVDQLPGETTQLRVMQAKDVAAGQDALRAVRGLSVALPLLTVLLWALALLVARGRRRVTVGQIGAGLIAVGVAVLVTRAVAKDDVLDALVLHNADRAAAGEAWSIATSLLRDGALAAIVVGVLLLLGAGLLGRGDPRGDELLDELSELSRLRASGALSVAEYERRRRRLLSAG